MVNLISLGLAVLPSIAAYRIPHAAVLPRQGVSNSSFAPSTTASAQTATIGSSSGAATITTAPLPTLSASANGTCPTAYPGNFPDHPFATFTETCQSLQSRELYDKFYYLTNTCLISHCEAQWTSTWDSIASADTTVWTTSTRTWFEGFFGSGSLSTVVTGQEYWTSTYTYPLDAAYLVTLEAPCCGRCTFADPTIQLYFWPTASAEPTPSVTGLPVNATAMVTGLPLVEGTYVDDNGFTFTSPSLYLGFTSLTAHNWCGPVGSEIYNTTIAFDPTEISTMFPQETRGTCTITGTSRDGTPYTTTALELTMPTPSPLTVADVAQDCSTIAGYSWFPNNPSMGGGDAGDPCHPVIALPTKVQELQPAWSDCLPVYGGFYDPPKTLKQGTALVPTTASETPKTTPEPEPSQVDPTSSQEPEPTQADPTSQDPGPTQADPTPSDTQTAAPSDPQEPSVSETVVPPSQPTEPAPGNSQSPAPGESQNSATSDPQDPATSDPQEPSAQPQPSPSPSDAPQQPSGPTQGSSTTIVITPPPNIPSSPSNPSVSAPVVTLGPGSSAGNASPGSLIPGISSPNVPNPSLSNANPQSPSLPNSQPNEPVITLQPTVIPPVNSGSGPDNTVIVIGTQTLSPGGVITVGGSTSTLPNGQLTVSGGTQLVLDPQGTQVIVGGTSTVNLPPAVPAQTSPVITVGGETITPAPSGPVVVGGQTLQPGSTIVVDDTTISLAPGGTQIVVDGTTIPLTDNTQTAAPVVVTVGSTTLTADSLTQFTIGDQTLTGGGTITESGTTYVLTTNAEGSTILVAGTAGASSVATLSASTTAASKSSAKGSSSAQGSASSTAEESATSTESSPPAPESSGGVGSIRAHWSLLNMFAIGGWAVLMV